MKSLSKSEVEVRLVCSYGDARSCSESSYFFLTFQLSISGLRYRYIPSLGIAIGSAADSVVL